MLKIIMIVASLLSTKLALASDVYIDQAGSSSTIDITQTGDGNKVGSAVERTTINGSGTDLDITQTGSGNTVDIETATGASGSDIEMVQTGSSNVANIDVGAASDLVLNVDIAGDSNETTLCGTATTAASALASASCATEMSQDDLGVDLDINGDTNKVAVNRSGISGTSGITEVKVNIGGSVNSNSNVVNITQSSTTESGMVDLAIDGSSNAVNILQQ